MSWKPELLNWTEESAKTLLEHYNRTPETVKVDIEIIQKWLEAQPHLPKLFTDRRIRSILVQNKMSPERVKRKIDMFFTVRKLLPEIFKDMQPYQPQVKEVGKYLHWVPLPKLTKDIYRPVLGYFEPEFSDTLDFNAILAYIFNIVEMWTIYDFQMGEIYIWDLKHAPFNFLTKFTPSMMKRATFISENAYSYKPRSIHIINCPSWMDAFITLAKSFLKQKVVDRVHVHKDLESLYQQVPQEYLPKEYGGEQGSVNEIVYNWNKGLQELSPWFDTLNDVEIDESLRPEKLIDDDFLGIHGNFRKLNLD